MEPNNERSQKETFMFSKPRIMCKSNVVSKISVKINTIITDDFKNYSHNWIKNLPSFKYFQSETNHLYLMNHDLCHPLQLYARRTRPVSAPTPALPSIQAIPLLRPRRTLKAPEPEPEPDPESNLFFFLEEDHEEIQPIGIFCRMFNCFGNCFNDNLIN